MQKNSLKKKSFDLSPKTHAVAKREELGEFRKLFPISKSNTTPFGIGCLCIIISFVLLGFTTAPALLLEIPYLWIGGAFQIILFIIGLYLMLSRKIYEHWYISLWQYGFIYEKKQTIQVFRWNRIKCIQRVVAAQGHGYFYRVQRQDGYEIKLGNNFTDFAELTNVVLEECIPYLAPQELSMQFTKNASMFTWFKLDRLGISDEKEIIPWKDIQETVIHKGAITVCKKTE